jgi:hypothetical protein
MPSVLGDIPQDKECPAQPTRVIMPYKRDPQLFFFFFWRFLKKLAKIETFEVF